MEHVVSKAVRDVSPIRRSRVVIELEFFLGAGGAVVGLNLEMDDDIDRPPVLELRKEGVLLDDLENDGVDARI
jgi:hypothetical protein